MQHTLTPNPYTIVVPMTQISDWAPNDTDIDESKDMQLELIGDSTLPMILGVKGCLSLYVRVVRVVINR